jgi:chromosome partitioning protein
MSRSMFVVALVALKGGAGKSTIAISIACEWQRRGLRVLIVDLDDQQRSVALWDDLRDDLGLEADPAVWAPLVPEDESEPDEFEDQYEAQTRGYDVVIIDTPGKLGRRPTAAMGRAHLVLIPCGPNGMEVATMKGTFAQVADVHRQRRSLDVGIVITKKQSGTVVGRTAHRAYVGKYQPLESELHYRLDYGQAPDAGMGPTTWAPAGEAAGEVRHLVNELEKRLGMGASAPRKGKTRGQ